jgi:uroporphyrinogen decarboxylase
MLILLTGVGTRKLVEAVDDRDRLIESLGKIKLVARGPKPTAALREIGLKPDIIVPQPNTWQDILTTLDAQSPVDGLRVAVQEYGISNEKLLQGLTDRGAQVDPVTVYQWALPEDLEPLNNAIEKIIAGEVDVAMFTSATQVHHLMQVGDGETLRKALKRVCIASVGPVATENIELLGLKVDYEPNAPHMTHLVRETSRRAIDLLDKKRRAADNGIDTNLWRRIDMDWAGDSRTIDDSVFMKACRREKVPFTPIWLMRQIGRYQRDYRKWKGNESFVNLPPDIAAELTLMAVERLGVDAAIILADLLPIIIPMGFHLEYVKGVGPVIDNPVRSRADLDRIIDSDASELQYVYDALSMVRKSLRPDIALIGFCGAPFTVASYIIEGGKSSDYANTKSLMRSDETAWHDLMQCLVKISSDYLARQIDAGADAVQVFDSWVGTLKPEEYQRYVQPHVAQLIGSVKKTGTPVIHFATDCTDLLPLIKETGCDIVGVDWRINLDDAWSLLGSDLAIMGNLDPQVLLEPSSQIRAAAKAVLDQADGRLGHIFNLGHGISPDMPFEHVAELVAIVHELSRR